MKKIALIAIAVIAFVGFTSAQTRNGLVLTDTQAAINFMYTNGLTKFSSTQTFMANQSLRRDEAAAFFARFARDVLGNIPDTSKTECDNFSDLHLGHNDLKWEIIASCKLGLFKGSNGRFMPNMPFSNAHAVTVLVRLIAGIHPETGSHRAQNYRNTARSLGLTNGLHAYHRNNIDVNITRGEVARLIEAGAYHKGVSTAGGNQAEIDAVNEILQMMNPSSITLTANNNNQPLAYGSEFTLSWIGQNIESCKTAGSNLLTKDSNAGSWLNMGFVGQTSNQKVLLQVPNISAQNAATSYTPSITCTDIYGKTISSSVTIPVKACGPNTDPYFTITSPKGGETFKPGDQITVKWESCNLSNNADAGIYLISEQPNGSRTLFIENAANNGQKTITIPIHLGQNMGYTAGQHYKIGIRNHITQAAYSNKISMNMSFCNGNNVSATWTPSGSGNQYLPESSSAIIGYIDITNHENCPKQITKIETVRRGYGDTEVNTLLNIINNLGFRYIYNDQMHMAFREIGPEGQTYPAIPKKQFILMPNTSARIVMSLQRSQTTSANLEDGVSFKVAPSNIVFEDKNGIKTNLPININDSELPTLITQ